MIIAWIVWMAVAPVLLAIGPAFRFAIERLRHLDTDAGLRRWLRKLYPNSAEVQGSAAIPAAWLVAYVAIGLLWHAVHAAVALAALPFELPNRSA